jgi:hypothetical protein
MEEDDDARTGNGKRMKVDEGVEEMLLCCLLDDDDDAECCEGKAVKNMAREVYGHGMRRGGVNGSGLNWNWQRGKWEEEGWGHGNGMKTDGWNGGWIGGTSI